MRKTIAVLTLLLGLIQVSPGEIVSIPSTTWSDFWNPEFSACLGLGDGSFIVVSDERKENGNERDELFRFNYATGGRMTGVNLPGDQDPTRLSDMEALAPDGAGGFWVMTSQSRVNDGSTDDDREKIAHFSPNGSTYVLNGVVKHFRNVIFATYGVEFGFCQDGLAKYGGLDLEGIAYDSVNQRMWFGLRGPTLNPEVDGVLGDYAVIMQLNGMSMTEWNTWASQDENYTTGQWQPLVYLNLGGLAIRDLYYAGNNQLYVLAGKMGDNTYVDENGQTVTSGDAYLVGYDVSTWTLNYCERIPSVTDSAGTVCHAEGISPITSGGQDYLLVVYDSVPAGIYEKGHAFPNPTADANGNSVYDWIETLTTGPDVDGDGLTDAEEIVAGSLVVRGSDTFKVASCVKVNNEIALSWNAEAGATYQVQSLSDLYNESWQTIATVVAADGPVTYDYLTTAPSQFFYVYDNGVTPVNYTPTFIPPSTIRLTWSGQAGHYYDVKGSATIGGPQQLLARRLCGNGATVPISGDQKLVRVLAANRVASANTVGYQSVLLPTNSAYEMTAVMFEPIDPAQRNYETLFAGLLTEGVVPAHADQLQFCTNSAGNWEIYAFKSGDHRMHMTTDWVGEPKSPVVNFGKAFWIYGKGRTVASNVVITGQINSQASYAMGIVTGYQMIAYPFASRTPINSSTLGNGQPGPVAGIIPARADQMQFCTPGMGSWMMYGLKSPDLKWRLTTAWVGGPTTDAFPTGRGMWYLRRGTTGFTWQEPNPCYTKLRRAW